MVSVNEGLSEGGGSYPIFSGFLMGYLSPLLKDELLLICDLNYYPGELKTTMAKLDWGFKKVKTIKKDSSGYISPALFSYSQRKSQSTKPFGHVFLMQRDKTEQQLHIPNCKTNVKVVHGSIWDNEDKLDLIGLNLLSKQSIDILTNKKNNTIDSFFRSKPKVIDIKGMPFEEILKYCEEKQLKKIGLTPWLKGNYNGVAEFLGAGYESGIEEIVLYHLHKKDFKSLMDYYN